MWKFGGLRGSALLGGCRFQSYVAAAARQQRLAADWPRYQVKPALVARQAQRSSSKAVHAAEKNKTDLSGSSSDDEAKQTGRQQRRRVKSPALNTQELSEQQQPQQHRKRRRRTKRPTTSASDPTQVQQVSTAKAQPAGPGADAKPSRSPPSRQRSELPRRQLQQQRQQLPQQQQPPQRQHQPKPPSPPPQQQQQQSQRSRSGAQHSAARQPPHAPPAPISRPDGRSNGSASLPATGSARRARRPRQSGLATLLAQEVPKPLTGATGRYKSAAEMLCAIGMTSEQAAECVRRASATASPAVQVPSSAAALSNNGTGNGDSRSVGNNTLATSSGSGTDDSDKVLGISGEQSPADHVNSTDRNDADPIISAAQAEHVSWWLVKAGIPVTALAPLLQRHPTILCADPAHDWLPKIRLLQDKGLELAGIERLLKRQPAWLQTAGLSEMERAATAEQLIPALRDLVSGRGLPAAAIDADLVLLAAGCQEYAANCRFLDALLDGDNGPLRESVSPALQLLPLADRLPALTTFMGQYGLGSEQLRRVVQSHPQLLAEDPCDFKATMSFLSVSGFQGDALASMLAKKPDLLKKDATDMQRKLTFLMQHRPKPGDEVLSEVAAYPQFFQHSLASCIGPRVTYLRARQQQEKLNLALTTLFSRSDYEFAEYVCKALVEDYVVYKAQWERTYGMQFGGKLHDVRSVVQPRRLVGAEGRFAIV